MPFHAQIDETFSAGLNLPGRWHKRPRWEAA
jgi:hypothetical protein